MVLEKPNICWFLLRVSVLGKLHEFGTFRLEKKKNKNQNEKILKGMKT